MGKLKLFLKNEILLVISWGLAVISMCFVHIDEQYISYIDFNTLGLLLALMIVMAGLSKLGIFEFLAKQLLKHVKSQNMIHCILVFLCFFSSMFITNDVALISFVPFTLHVLNLTKMTENIVYVVVLQTIAANLGSMLTPMGNPQNLYLYSLSNMNFIHFISIMLPYVILSAFLLMICIFIKKDKSIEFDIDNHHKINKKEFLFYSILFMICIMSVLKIISVYMACFITILSVFIYDRSLFKKVDYSLLLTFVAFFIFVGNVGRLPLFQNIMRHLLQGRVVLTTILASQVISNVPAALLLSGFSDNIQSLIIGSNLGGLGTMIASMASLISYKYIVKECQDNKGKYFQCFTILNIIFLVVNMIGFYLFSSI